MRGAPPSKAVRRYSWQRPRARSRAPVHWCPPAGSPRAGRAALTSTTTQRRASWAAWWSAASEPARQSSGCERAAWRQGPPGPHTRTPRAGARSKCSLMPPRLTHCVRPGRAAGQDCRVGTQGSWPERGRGGPHHAPSCCAPLPRAAPPAAHLQRDARGAHDHPVHLHPAHQLHSVGAPRPLSADPSPQRGAVRRGLDARAICLFAPHSRPDQMQHQQNQHQAGTGPRQAGLTMSPLRLIASLPPPLLAQYTVKPWNAGPNDELTNEALFALGSNFNPYFGYVWDTLHTVGERCAAGPLKDPHDSVSAHALRFQARAAGPRSHRKAGKLGPWQHGGVLAGLAAASHAPCALRALRVVPLRVQTCGRRARLPTCGRSSQQTRRTLSGMTCSPTSATRLSRTVRGSPAVCVCVCVCGWILHLFGRLNGA